jgi:energy-coupling factor transporter ATP-binding protein EcfA2
VVTLKVQNFKSIDDLEIELGRVNLLIGENGCGKSSILEAIGMASAAADDDLSPGALKARGIRVTDPSWMRSAFEERTKAMPVRLTLRNEISTYAAILTHDNTPYGVWRNQVASDLAPLLKVPGGTLEDLSDRLNALSPDVRASLKTVFDLSNLPVGLSEASDLARERFVAGALWTTGWLLKLPAYLAYAPREDVLRDLARDSDVEPIGVHGEGLFKLLEVLHSEGKLPAVKEQLALLGWFDDISITSGVNPSSRTLQLRDIFLDGATPFDQRSANEGFLFVLLYACLLISPHTPRFFAVDNVDTALNPKLCAGTVRMFAELTKKYDKRVVLTAHNPGALDGLNLHDDDVRLFVVYRNTEGKTQARRIMPVDVPAGTEPVRLSEAFLRGYLGALPTNF